MNVRYIRTNYLYGKEAFYLYKPIELDIIQEEFNKKGVATKIRYNKSGKIKSYPLSGYEDIVKEFTKDDNNRLLSEYNEQPVYISCVHRTNGYKGIDKRHKRCEVLTEKHGGYTKLKCHSCGEIGIIALNSWEIISKGAKYDIDCQPVKD